MNGQLFEIDCVTLNNLLGLTSVLAWHFPAIIGLMPLQLEIFNESHPTITTNEILLSSVRLCVRFQVPDVRKCFLAN